MIKKIKELVETETGIQDISLKKRTQSYVEARVLYSNLALKHTKFTTERIGAEINKSHCSVVHHKKIFTQWIQLKKFYAQNLKSFKTIESLLEDEKVKTTFNTKEDAVTNAVDLYRKYKRENIILQKQNNKLIKKLNKKQKEVDEKLQLLKNTKRDASYWLTLYKRVKENKFYVKKA